MDRPVVASRPQGFDYSRFVEHVESQRRQLVDARRGLVQHFADGGVLFTRAFLPGRGVLGGVTQVHVGAEDGDGLVQAQSVNQFVEIYVGVAVLLVDDGLLDRQVGGDDEGRFGRAVLGAVVGLHRVERCRGAVPKREGAQARFRVGRAAVLAAVNDQRLAVDVLDDAVAEPVLERRALGDVRPREVQVHREQRAGAGHLGEIVLGAGVVDREADGGVDPPVLVDQALAGQHAVLVVLLAQIAGLLLGDADDHEGVLELAVAANRGLVVNAQSVEVRDQLGLGRGVFPRGGLPAHRVLGRQDRPVVLLQQRADVLRGEILGYAAGDGALVVGESAGIRLFSGSFPVASQIGSEGSSISGLPGDDALGCFFITHIRCLTSAQLSVQALLIVPQDGLNVRHTDLDALALERSPRPRDRVQHEAAVGGVERLVLDVLEGGLVERVRCGLDLGGVLVFARRVGVARPDRRGQGLVVRQVGLTQQLSEAGHALRGRLLQQGAPVAVEGPRPPAVHRQVAIRAHQVGVEGTQLRAEDNGGQRQFDVGLVAGGELNAERPGLLLQLRHRQLLQQRLAHACRAECVVQFLHLGQVLVDAGLALRAPVGDEPAVSLEGAVDAGGLLEVRHDLLSVRRDGDQRGEGVPGVLVRGQLGELLGEDVESGLELGRVPAHPGLLRVLQLELHFLGHPLRDLLRGFGAPVLGRDRPVLGALPRLERGCDLAGAVAFVRVQPVLLQRLAAIAQGRALREGRGAGWRQLDRVEHCDRARHHGVAAVAAEARGLDRLLVGGGDLGRRAFGRLQALWVRVKVVELRGRDAGLVLERPARDAGGGLARVDAAHAEIGAARRARVTALAFAVLRRAARAPLLGVRRHQVAAVAEVDQFDRVFLLHDLAAGARRHLGREAQLVFLRQLFGRHAGARSHHVVEGGGQRGVGGVDVLGEAARGVQLFGDAGL